MIQDEFCVPDEQIDAACGMQGGLGAGRLLGWVLFMNDILRALPVTSNISPASKRSACCFLMQL